MRWAEVVKGSMMGLWDLDQGGLEEYYELLEEDVTDSEWVMQNATERKYKLRFENIYGKVPTLSLEEYRAFIKKWPHMDDLGECERPSYTCCHSAEYQYRDGAWD